MAIRDWPETERPREKLLQRGPSSLSDAELLALFLRTGTAGLSALDLARELLTEFGDLRALLEAGPDRLVAIRGVGNAKYVVLQAALELGRRHLATSLERGEALSNPQQTSQYLTAELRHHPYEVFACLFLDNRHRVIRFEKLFTGTIDSASVHPREVVSRALELHAAALILAHNHPSGVAEPSHADERLTRKLKEALALVDIRVLDHLVIGDGDSVSFAERGLL